MVKAFDIDSIDMVTKIVRGFEAENLPLEGLVLSDSVLQNYHNFNHSELEKNITAMYGNQYSLI